MKTTTQNLAKKFEIRILRPLLVIFIAMAIFFLIKGMWLYLGGVILCLFYLGIVGSKLHPYQSISDLANGPLQSSASVTESKSLSPEIIKILVDRACTHVGILIGLASAIALWTIADWHWYFAILIALFAIIIVGASLKLVVKAWAGTAS